MIYKATFTITVLVEAENAGEAWQSFLQDPHTILEEMDSGVMIGSCTAPEVSEVPADKVREELLALGNDGSFFA